MKYMSLLLLTVLLTACATTAVQPTAAERSLQQINADRMKTYTSQVEREAAPADPLTRAQERLGPSQNHADYLAAQGRTPEPISPPRPMTSAQTELECLALASQAAMGAGAWTSVAPVRAAIYDNAKAQYFQQCMASKSR
jgi:hypothetical protein